MPENPEANPATAVKPANEPSQVAEGLSEIVRRAMLEVAQLQEIQERVTAMSERIARLTPPPDRPPGSSEIIP